MLVEDQAIEGLRTQGAVVEALRMSVAISVPGPVAPRRMRCEALSSSGSSCSDVRAIQTPRRESALGQRSCSHAPRRCGLAAWHCLRRSARTLKQGQSATAAQSRASASVRGLSRSPSALRGAVRALHSSGAAGAVRRAGVSSPGSHNPSIERTSKRLRLSAAAHVER